MFLDVDVALSGVPANILPLLDDTDFKSIETAVAYNAAGMTLKWNFVASDGTFTQTAVTPTTAGVYDWNHKGGGMYSMEIPASGGGSINNDTEGYGWFSGVATGVLPWRGPVVGFRAAGLNDLLTDSAYSTTRGLTGTALPAVAAEAAGGLYTRGSGAGQLSQSANGELGVATLAKTLTTYTGNTVQTGDAFARLGAPAGASTAADIAAVNVKTTNLPASPASTTNITAASGVVLSAAGVQAIWDALMTALTTVGSVGKLLADNLNATVGSRLATSGYTAPLDAAATRAALGLASANLDTQLSTIDDFLDTEIAAILAAVDTEVAAILALLDDPRTEPGQVAPPVNPDMATKVDYLYKSWRNKKTNDGTVTNLYADDATTVDQKQATSEAAGTVTKGEWAVGP